ncbi:MAG TPA: bifunctional adenosylcobinamide kinase/adenosylcobinamide-phosphate guanylyltransferase [Candidatus Ornithomonoglobus intestinigallinarum]|uniref:Adenosylcobinamide kinase n=1 Tax=Candidatus Ornithomonoglobus intestinigallinarum TaxID=2840894 RepID=A0A9D1H410_9FIRM|nr:bifunctional adenosylcobinamide kinase/adenosylcobinamide-phosphate guanylyltransferase [Candidatus Ornithomonoglobus intestinigallinarum]
MLILVTGGSASGKSEFAENKAAGFGGVKIYLAAMKPFGKSAAERIEKHRRNRAGKGFETAERFTDIGGAKVSGTVLLEDLGNVIANEMFSGDTKINGDTETELLAEKIFNDILTLYKSCENLIIVSDNVFEDGCGYGAETEKYIELAGRLNIMTASSADEVWEVVCGTAERIK